MVKIVILLSVTYRFGVILIVTDFVAEMEKMIDQQSEPIRSKWVAGSH